MFLQTVLFRGMPNVWLVLHRQELTAIKAPVTTRHFSSKKSAQHSHVIVQLIFWLNSPTRVHVPRRSSLFRFTLNRRASIHYWGCRRASPATEQLGTWNRAGPAFARPVLHLSRLPAPEVCGSPHVRLGVTLTLPDRWGKLAWAGGGE